jgi:uncharacterized damage-inducible protein DinB
MSQPHPINQTLLTLLDNQVARTTAAFEDIERATFDAEPGSDCNSIRRISEHMVKLRGFMLKILESPLAEQMPQVEPHETLEHRFAHLDRATRLLHQAIEQYPPDQWHTPPAEPREGPWGDEPTLARLSRPFNDFVNHLGAIRTIRRIVGDPAPRTQ